MMRLHGLGQLVDDKSVAMQVVNRLAASWYLKNQAWYKKTVQPVLMILTKLLVSMSFMHATKRCFETCANVSNILTFVYKQMFLTKMFSLIYISHTRKHGRTLIRNNVSQFPKALQAILTDDWSWNGKWVSCTKITGFKKIFPHGHFWNNFSLLLSSYSFVLRMFKIAYWFLSRQ